MPNIAQVVKWVLGLGISIDTDGIRLCLLEMGEEPKSPRSPGYISLVRDVYNCNVGFSRDIESTIKEKMADVHFPL